MAKLTEMDWRVVKAFADCNMNKSKAASIAEIAASDAILNVSDTFNSRKSE